jgi:hypothetical protein
MNNITGCIGIGTTSPTATFHVNGTLGVDAIALQSALAVDRELVQAYDNVGSQLISRHGGGYGDEAITHANMFGSSSKVPNLQKYFSPFTTSRPSALRASGRTCPPIEASWQL